MVRLIHFILVYIFFLSLTIKASTDSLIHLRDSTVINGKIIQVKKSFIIIENQELGRLKVPKGMIVDTSLYQQNKKPYYFYDNHSQLFFTPTSFLPQIGTIDLSFYNILYFATDISITNHTVLQIRSLPYIKNYKEIRLGLKQQVFINQNKSFSASISTSFTKPYRYDQPYVDYYWNISLIVSYCVLNRLGIHANLGYVYKKINGGLYYEDSGIINRVDNRNELHGLDYALGIDYRLHPNIKVMLENFNDFGYFRTNYHQYTNFSSLSTRFMWKYFEIDLGFLKPFDITSSASYYFQKIIPFGNIHFAVNPLSKGK